MTTQDWQPGDVALVDSWRGVNQIAFRCERDKADTVWCVLDGHDTRGLTDAEVLRAQPVAVIAYEDREECALFDHIYQRALDSAPQFHSLAEVTQTALRQFANSEPPKPNEPMRLGAVVEDQGRRFTRAISSPGSWPWVGETGGVKGWSELSPAVRVLSEGIPIESTS